MSNNLMKNLYLRNIENGKRQLLKRCQDRPYGSARTTWLSATDTSDRLENMHVPAALPNLRMAGLKPSGELSPGGRPVSVGPPVSNPCPDARQP